MPIYEYECSACGHHLETLQKISAPTLTDCPVCGKSTLSKLISNASFRLKGGGWYETDFKSKKNIGHSGAPSSDSSSASSTASANTTGSSSTTSSTTTPTSNSES